MKMIEKILDGYFPASILAKDLGIESKDFLDTTLERVVFKRVMLVRVPSTAIHYIQSVDYTPALLEPNETADEYDYVLNISNKVRVGFWK